jgi:hypothetical protein
MKRTHFRFVSCFVCALHTPLLYILITRTDFDTKVASPSHHPLLPDAVCDTLKIGRIIGSGITKQVYEVNIANQTAVMKSVLANNIDQQKNPNLPFFKILKEYLLFKEMELQFPSTALKVYGICFRDNSYASATTLHAQLHHGVHLMLEMGKPVPNDCSTINMFRELNDRLVEFKAGPIGLNDVKLNQFVLTDTGIHVSDLDDSDINDVHSKERIRRNNARKIDALFGLCRHTTVGSMTL